MRGGNFCRQVIAVAAMGLFALSGCGGEGKKSAASDANLSSLVLSAGTLAPAFSAETTAYTAEVAFAESTVTVTATAESGKATITVNGASVQSGTASQSISLALGSNAITVVVTAEDGTTTRTYTVTVTRQGAASNANLSSLVLSAGTLAPAFSAGTTSYSAEVLSAVSSMTVTPTAESGKATITVNGASVQSGTASQSISLALGSNAIAVVVTAEDGTTTRTYTVSVKRQEVDAGTWVEISPGTFTMGSPTAELGRYSNEVQHQVTLTRSFVMLSTEVTQEEFEKRMEYNPSYFPTDGSTCPTCPVETVNWHEAAAYCNVLSTAAGLRSCYKCTAGAMSSDVACIPSLDFATPYECPGYRLPTEAEWEYAARAGDQRATYAGELTATDCTDTTLGPIAWFCGNSDDTTHAVGTRASNDLDLYDMLGNVWEWCHDWYDTYQGNATDPQGPETGDYRVFRGGSWYYVAGFARAAFRHYDTPGCRDYYQGLRPVRSLP